MLLERLQAGFKISHLQINYSHCMVYA